MSTVSTTGWMLAGNRGVWIGRSPPLSGRAPEMTRIWIAAALAVGLFATPAAACSGNQVREFNPETNREECMNLEAAQEIRDRRFVEEQKARALKNQLRRQRIEEAQLQHRRRLQQRQRTRTLRLMREQRSLGR